VFRQGNGLIGLYTASCHLKCKSDHTTLIVHSLCYFSEIVHVHFKVKGRTTVATDQFQHSGQTKSNLAGQIYCTFPMSKPIIVNNNVTTYKKWLTNF